jgi:hypothetical protein
VLVLALATTPAPALLAIDNGIRYRKLALNVPHRTGIAHESTNSIHNL